MRGEQMRESNSPVWVVGGGKTGMDTAHALVTAYPGREVNLLAGSGTLFYSRDKGFPTGRQRWRAGSPGSVVYSQWARQFDGTNEAEAMAWFRSRLGVWLTPQSENCYLGILSEAEKETVRGGLREVVMDYFVDCVDADGAIKLILRTGATRDLAPDSWIVNCTGYLRPRDKPYEPYLSKAGNVLSIQARSAFGYLPAYSAYFLSHLFFSGKLATVPLYEVDLDALRATASREAYTCTLISHLAYNMSQIPGNAPMKVIAGNGTDYDRWFPLPRRLKGQVQVLAGLRKSKSHYRRTLDTVRERFDVRCGPLDHVTEAAPRL
jgi:hypothetical protein